MSEFASAQPVRPQIGAMSDAVGALAGARESLDAALPGILQDFYAWAAKDPELAPYLKASSRSTTALAQSQRNHWNGLLRSGADAAFLDRARMIGHIHQRIGLPPRLYMAGYDFVLKRLLAILGRRNRFNGKRAIVEASALLSLMMQDMSVALGAYSERDAQVSANSKGEDFANGLLDSSVQVSIEVNEAAISAVRMLHAIEQVDRQAQGISAAVEETVTGIQQISQTTRDVTDIARDADQQAKAGAATVHSAEQRMADIHRVVATTATLVNELAESSKAIGAIVATIEEIAGQTNLLALNATIEAARAGEAGKGFAVVAGEVKSLSQQTAKATDEIRGRIGALVSEMDRIVGSMRQANDAVESGQTAMHEVSERMTDLASAVTEVSARMEQVSSILDEQTSAANEVAGGVARISQETGRNVGDLSHMTENMQRMESQIGQQLSKFMEYDVPHKVLRIAKADHVIWKKRLADMLAGKARLKPEELTDHTKCRLGRFYYGPEAARYRAAPSFQKLEGPHKAVHANGIEAVRRYNAGQMDAALKSMALVEQASAEVLDLLDGAVREMDGGFARTGGF